MRTKKLHNEERRNSYTSASITQLQLVRRATSSDVTLSHFVRKPLKEGVI